MARLVMTCVIYQQIVLIATKLYTCMYMYFITMYMYAHVHVYVHTCACTCTYMYIHVCIPVLCIYSNTIHFAYKYTFWKVYLHESIEHDHAKYYIRDICTTDAETNFVQMYRDFTIPCNRKSKCLEPL